MEGRASTGVVLQAYRRRPDMINVALLRAKINGALRDHKSLFIGHCLCRYCRVVGNAWSCHAPGADSFGVVGDAKRIAMALIADLQLRYNIALGARRRLMGP